MKRWIFLCSCFAATALTHAADPARVDTTSMKRLQAAQVSSTRATKKMPMAFTTMTRADLAAVNFGKDIPALLSAQPSVLASSDAGTGIGYSGLRVRGTDATRVNVTMGGIPINDSESNNVFWVNMPDLASSLGSIQLQRGVGTSTNGAGAFGATVNMEAQPISSKPYLQLDASGGSYGTHKESLSFGTGLLKNHWGLSGRLSNIGSDGYIDRASAKLNSYFLQGGYFGDGTVVKFITFNGTEETYHAWDYATKADMAEKGRTHAVQTCSAGSASRRYRRSVERLSVNRGTAIDGTCCTQNRAKLLPGFGIDALTLSQSLPNSSLLPSLSSR